MSASRTSTGLKRLSTSGRSRTAGSMSASVQDPQASNLASSDAFTKGGLDRRDRFLPTLVKVEENRSVAEQLRRYVESGNLDGVRLLLYAGVPAGLPLDDHKITGLHIAAGRNDALMCQMLLSFNADPHAYDMSPAGGETPLEIAMEHENLPVVHLFLMQGPSPQPLDPGPKPGLSRMHEQSRLPLLANEKGFMPRAYI
mmetsp:Transcript_21911/g.63182  ORF Transcript_21911/g.63182 Transcript_21911/m.63182 type:complete len:199 (+) Transcript_21911:47-643(+)